MTPSSNETRNYPFNPTLPVDIVYNKIEDLLEFGGLAGNPYSNAQVISLGYNLFKKSGVFNEYIRSWNRHPAVEKTWPVFKTHFRDAQKELRETDGLLTLQDAGFHQANMVERIVVQLRTENALALTQQARSTESALDNQIEQLANAALNQQSTTTGAMPQLIQQMQQMQEATLHSLQANQGRPGSSR